MAPLAIGVSHLANQLATPEQLALSASRIQGVPKDLEESVRYRTSCVVQAVGILLRLPQHTIAETIVIFCRFWIGAEGGSLLDHSAKDVAAAALYLVTKTGPYPLSPKQLLNAFNYVIHASGNNEDDRTDTTSLYSEGQLESDRAALIRAESQILKLLGFRTHVALPHALCMHYLQTLDALSSDRGQGLARRAYTHLNSALLSPQLLYLTHQPCALAVAAIYLGAREMDVNLPEEQWWEVFDVDREELGFLVVAMTSMTGFAQDQKLKYKSTSVPLTTQEIREEMQSRLIPQTDSQA